MATEDAGLNRGRQPAEPFVLVTVQEMAAILKVPPSWLYQRTRLGPKAIPHFRAGKYIRFSPEEVLAFLRAKRAGGSDAANGVS